MYFSLLLHFFGKRWWDGKEIDQGLLLLYVMSINVMFMLSFSGLIVLDTCCASRLDADVLTLQGQDGSFTLHHTALHWQ